MEYTVEEESKKIIELRDSILNDQESCNDPEFIRLKIEKKLRDEVKKTSSYNKLLKNGRVDLIDSKRRNEMVTSIEDLQAAYYENYKPRKDREYESISNDHKRAQYEKPVTTDSFYDDADDDVNNVSKTTGIKSMKLKPTSTGVKPLPQYQQQSSMISNPQFQQSSSPSISNISTPIHNSTNFANIQPPFMPKPPNFPTMPQMNQMPQMPQLPQNPQQQQQWALQQQLIQNQKQSQQQQQQQPLNAFMPFPFLPLVPQMNGNNTQQPQPQHQQQFQLYQNYQQPSQVLNYEDGSDSKNENTNGIYSANSQNRPLQPY